MSEPGLDKIRVEIEWVDTQTTLGWTSDHLTAQPAVNYTDGFIVHKDDKIIKLAHTWNSSAVADVTVIPNSIIVGKPHKLVYYEELLRLQRRIRQLEALLAETEKK